MQRNLLGQFKVVNCLKGRTGACAGCDPGLLNIRIHIILLLISHMSYNHSAFLFGVSGPLGLGTWVEEAQAGGEVEK